MGQPRKVYVVELMDSSTNIELVYVATSLKNANNWCDENWELLDDSSLTEPWTTSQFIITPASPNGALHRDDITLVEYADYEDAQDRVMQWQKERAGERERLMEHQASRWLNTKHCVMELLGQGHLTVDDVANELNCSMDAANTVVEMMVAEQLLQHFNDGYFVGTMRQVTAI